MHQEQHLKSSDFITDIVIGMSDGLTVPFVVATGVSAVANTTATIVIAGLAATVLGAIAMGVGGYFAGKSTAEDEHHNEQAELLGLDKEIQSIIIGEIAKEKEVLNNYKEEYGLAESAPAEVRKSALIVALSYIAGGIIPLLPYFFIKIPAGGLKMSACITIISLFILGYIKAKITGQNTWAGALRMVLISVIAATVVYFVADLFV